MRAVIANAPGGPEVLQIAETEPPTAGQVAVVGLLGGPPIIESFNLMGDLPNTARPSFFSSDLLGSPRLPLDSSPLNWVAEQVACGAIADTVSHTFAVKQIQDAHRLLDSGRAAGKIVVTV